MKKVSSEEPSTTKPQKEYVELRLPKLSFRNTSINVYLVSALVIFAFLLGMLTNKVLYLEKAVKGTDTSKATTANAQDTPAAEPTLPPVVNVDVGKLPILGDAKAKVTIVEFSDFQCPFCKSYQDQTHAQLDKEYIQTGKVRFAYRQFPLTTIHPNAHKAAEAAECANEQNKFWEYHDMLFTNQDTWSPQTGTDLSDSFTNYATQLGMDADQFRSCLDGGKYTKQVDEDAAAGTAAQVDGTPAFFVNGRRVVGALPFDDFKKIIDEELKK